MKVWTTIAACVLLIQSASAGYDDWDSVVASSNNDIKQSYGGGGGGGDDSNAVALTSAPVVVAPAPAPVVVAPTTGTDTGGNTNTYGGGNGDDNGDNNDDNDDDDDDDSDAPAAAPSSAPVVAPASADPAPATAAPSPAVTPAPTTTAPTLATGNGDSDDNNDDNDDDDGDDDGDDDEEAPAPAIYGGKPYEQNDAYSGGKQTTKAPQTQTDTSTGDSKPNVNNGGVNLYPYTQELRDYIVQTHNWARGNLAPSQAANMRQLSWDESLAIEASELVNTCVFEHDTENYAYGQNLMYGGNSLDKTMIDGWMDGWVKNELSAYDRAGTGFMDLDHASAVLWANSYLVGCASKMCSKGYLTACNYYTPGNWQGEQAYIPGPSCSQCPSKAPYCDATGKLCTADPTGATPTSKPNTDQSQNQSQQDPAPTPAKTNAAPVVAPAPPASVPAPTPAKSTTAGQSSKTPVPAATPAKTTPSGGSKLSPKVTPAPTIPHELCV